MQDTGRSECATETYCEGKNLQIVNELIAIDEFRSLFRKPKDIILF